jgi:hypothetical protein
MLADDFHDPTRPEEQGRGGEGREGRGEVTRPAEQGWIRFARRFKMKTRATNKKTHANIWNIGGTKGNGVVYFFSVSTYPGFRGA